MISQSCHPHKQANCAVFWHHLPTSELGDKALGQQSSAVTHQIDTGDALPIRPYPYRVSHTERGIIQKEVDIMLAKDIIESSYRPWAAQVVSVKKKDGICQFCVDNRHLNRVTKKDVYPLPRINDT